MNLYLKHTLFYLLGISYALISSAQSNPDKLQCKVTGRMLLDGGVYLKNDNNFGNGVEFSDLRIGAKVAYQNWDMKLEIGYTGNKATIKDAFAKYTYKNHSIQVGQFYEPFSLEMMCSTFDIRFNQSPGAVLALTNGRRMGITYSYRNKRHYMSGGAFMDNEVNNLKKASHGYALDGRVVYRPVLDSKKLIHRGFAANYRTPNESLNEEDKNIFIYKSPGVSTIDNRNIAMATIDHAAYQIKFGTELLVYYHRFCLQSEYIRTHVERDNAFKNYVAQGAYLQCSWLLSGETYLYDESVACAGRPEGKSLEVCSRFNYLTLNDEDAAIWGGEQKDISIGLNYYINKYIGIKLNYSYLMPGASIKEISRKNFSVFQGRFQFIF